MCTRFSRVSDIQALARRYFIEGPLIEMRPDYNISPTNPVYVIEDPLSNRYEGSRTLFDGRTMGPVAPAGRK